MEDRERQPSRAEQRMLAVAKLKRAASLPRMKDGRRPPMHPEALSEGEKPPTDTEQPLSEEEKKDEEYESPPPEDARIEAVETEADADVEDRAMSPRPSSRAKRRSRSRSRSRGSKDFKHKARAANSPTPGSFNHGDSSQDDEPPLPHPQLTIPIHPQLLSPIPSQFAMINQRLLRSPTPGSPEPSFFPPGASPALLPSLEAIQKGLLRSNSAGSAAASRRLAMHKLTGGTDTYDPSPSPTPPPISGKLGRNNTIAGGERTAARELMLSRLGGRITKETDGEQGSGSEDRAMASPSPNLSKRRRRRSGRGSQSNILPQGTSDSDFVSTSTSTPQVPPTPLPLSRLDYHNDLRAQSATPNQAYSSRRHSGEYVSDSVPPSSATRTNGTEQENHELIRRRSVLVEDEDEEEESPPPATTQYPRYPGLPGTPPNRFPAQVNALRVAHGSDAPSSTSTDSTNASPTAVGVPVYLSHTITSRHDGFPSSPFMTPLKERTISDDDDDQIMYQADYRPRTPHSTQLVDNSEREISWVADPVPEIRMVIDNEDVYEEEEEEGEEEEQQDATEDHYEEQEYEEPPLSAVSSSGFSREVYDDTSPRLSASSKSLVVESEALPDSQILNVPPSPSSIAALSQTTSLTRASDGSLSSQTYPQRLSIASRVNGNSSDWDERDSAKRAETASPTFWEKMKGAVSRAGSSAGRRSRTNSIATRERRDHTDSSISRESGISLTGSKTDRGDSIGTFTQTATTGPQPLMQSPSASASILSLGPPYTPSRGGPSPIPPPSSTDSSRYANPKLFPFPGMAKLEEERRAKGLPIASSSTPDITMLTSASDDYPPLSPPFYGGSSANDARDRGLNASETRLGARYVPDGSITASPDYFNVGPPAIQSSGSQSSKLPMTFPDVMQWLSRNKKKGVPSQGSSPVPGTPPAIDTQGITNTIKKPSLSDLLKVKDSELDPDWEELGSAVDTSTSETLSAKKSSSPAQLSSVQLAEDDRSGVTMNGSIASKSDHVTTDNEKTPKAKKVMPLSFSPGVERASLVFEDSPIKQYSSPTPDPQLSATPDPSSSLSDYPAASTSESSSSSSSQYSLTGGPNGQSVLQRLDESLSRYSRDSLWSLSGIEDPPRKLVMSSAVLQVVNPNTVKDRFLFHFNDILVIAKPLLQDQDNLMDAYTKPSPLDRKFVVKSVVQMRHLRLSLERSQMQTRTPGDVIPSKNSLMKAFIHQFATDPDHAIDTLLSKSVIPDDPAVIGQLLFKILDLNRAQLGEYLSKRSTKAVLKAYLDNFGFLGLRIDKALRVFLLSISVPARASALEYLLDAFAGRWYDANAKAITYDKDFAIRLVRALVQLNEILHGGVSQEPGPTGGPLHVFPRREFLSAFRRFDTRCLVSDEVLGEVYDSLLQERLCQAQNTADRSSPDLSIITKRPVPARVTYKIQSEPIILRIPQADPDFTIQLYGQDLEFDPPVLTFAKSPEASFRVTGTSLGSKTMIFCRSGSNALKYSGLPLSNTIVVERTFMRYTFQLAFLNHAGAKRRYMFSFHESATYRIWVDSLKQYIESATVPAVSPGALKAYKAAENVAFKILQETLISPLGGPSTAVQDALNHLNGSSPFGRNGISSLRGNRLPNHSAHVRSKSRSKIYHHGAGRNESFDLRSGTSHFKSSSDDDERSDTNQIHHREESGSVEGLLWSNRDLLIHCQQNSLIPLVLEHLQVWPSGQDKGSQGFTR